LENREAINTKIRRGIAQLDRGEGIPEDQLDAYLAKLKAQPNDIVIHLKYNEAGAFSCPQTP